MSSQENQLYEFGPYVIDGRKRFISNAGIADFYTVFARTGTRDDGRAEISAFIVSARMPGFSVAERTEMIAPHPIGEIAFNECRVPAEDMVGNDGDGFKLAMETMDTFRASVGAAACGMARRALDQAVRYASGRKQFGRLLSEHQLVQAKLADMITELDAARLLPEQLCLEVTEKQLSVAGASSPLLSRYRTGGGTGRSHRAERPHASDGPRCGSSSLRSRL